MDSSQEREEAEKVKSVARHEKRENMKNLDLVTLLKQSGVPAEENPNKYRISAMEVRNLLLKSNGVRSGDEDDEDSDKKKKPWAVQKKAVLNEDLEIMSSSSGD